MKNLTKRTIFLMSLARKVKRSCNLTYVWSRKGNLYIRERDNSQIMQIKCEEDLYNIERRCKEQATEVLAQNVLNC